MPMVRGSGELKSSIWAQCEELRGGMDAGQYGYYVLVLLFLKIITDRSSGSPPSPIFIPPGSSFGDLVALKGAPDIGEQINRRILEPLASYNNLAGLPDFSAIGVWGSGAQLADRLSKLIAIFESPALDFSRRDARGGVGGGELFDYLLNRFAMESSEKSDHHTPAEVGRLVAGVIGIGNSDPGDTTTLYDPACGAGSLMLAVAGAGRKGDLQVQMFGQDKDASIVCLARMNMIVHEYFTARIRWGNSLANPLFRDGDRLRTFDFAVAHPPFADTNWSQRFDPQRDPFQRFAGYAVPSADQGEYAFLLHVLHSLNQQGQGACILPYHALTHGGAAGSIRRLLMRQGFIEAIIGLPQNILPGSEDAACIIVHGQEPGRGAERHLHDRCYERLHNGKRQEPPARGGHRAHH